MKEKTLFYGILFLSAVSLLIGMQTANVWMILVSVGLALLGSVAAGSKPGAPHAEDHGLGSVHHQSVYIRAMNRCLDRIAATRAMMRDDPEGARGEWYRKYDRAKWTYSLLYHRYEEAKKFYNWKY